MESDALRIENERLKGELNATQSRMASEYEMDMNEQLRRNRQDKEQALYALSRSETAFSNQLAQLQQREEEVARLREICEAVAEEVIEYLNISTPSGRPAEPSLAEAVRQMKMEYCRKLAALRA